MRIAAFLSLLCLPLLAPMAAQAQASDIAAERARIADQRVRVEAERKAREEQERLEQAAQQALQEAPQDRAEPAGIAPPPPPEPRPAHTASERTSAAAVGDPLSQALEQLRTLGELKDAGYVTETEFERIKRRILDNRF